jgi:hypothetical protein
LHEDEVADAEVVPVINKRSNSHNKVRPKSSAVLVCHEEGVAVVVVNNMFRPMYLRTLARLRKVLVATEAR